MISSVANPTVKRVRRLRKRAWRERTGRYIVEGRRAVEVALASGATIHALLHTPRATRLRAILLADARDAHVPISEVSDAVMAYLCSVATAPDVLAVAEIRDASLASLRAGSSGVLLDGVRDPATAGGILATAAAAGMTFGIAARATVDIYQQSAVRAAAGAHFRMQIVRDADPDAAVKQVRGAGARVVALAEEGPAPWESDLRGPVLVAVPGERSEPVEGERVAVPSLHAPASLGARAAVVLYEWVRQGRQG